MADRTSRRSVMAAIGGAAAAFAAGVSMKLFGRREDETMQLESRGGEPPAARPLAGVFPPGPDHWVGDGFYVKTVFSPHPDPALVSPFLLLDHAARKRFDPSPWRRGVGEHPHRGFETVTFAYDGEIEHRDSSGGGGKIGPGDVQWMTAASGVVHEEKHSQAFSERGGEFEMVQLWVNLPADRKMSSPRYQPLLDREFPRLDLGVAEARLIAGELAGRRGPAKTHTPITVFDLRFHDEGSTEVQLPKGWTTLLFPLEGDLSAGPEHTPVPSRHFAVFDRHADGVVRLSAESGTRALVLAGKPLDEPVVAYGPFVMNTREEIMQAFRDYQSGRMGRLL